MADPLSIAASAAGVATLVVAVARKLPGLAARVSSAKRTAENFETSIELLKTILENVEKTFTHRSDPHDFERKHWEDIETILRSCNGCLYAVDKAIPEVNSWHERLVSKLKKEWKNELLTTQRANIASYTKCLQVSMTAVSVVNHWSTQDGIDRLSLGQDNLFIELHQLRQEIRQVKVYFECTCREARSISASSVGDSRHNAVRAESTASRNIERWTSSSETMVAAMSRYGPSILSNPEPVIETSQDVQRSNSAVSMMMQSPVSDDEDGFQHIDSRDINPDTNPDGLYRSLSYAESVIDVELDDQTPLEDLERRISNYRYMVAHAESHRLYNEAERGLRKLMELLAERDGKDFVEQRPLEMRLARFRYGQGTREGRSEAKVILKKLLTQSDADGSSTDDIEACRDELTFLLASIYLDEGQLGIALRFGHDTLNRRTNRDAGNVAVKDANLLLSKIYASVGDYIDAMTYRAKAQEIDATGVGADLNVFRWLQDHGFLGELGSYNNHENTKRDYDIVNQPHPQNHQTPIQLAIQREEVDMLKELLDYGADREILDENGATPLLLAASAGSGTLVSALLDNDVNIRARDNAGNTALHCAADPCGKAATNTSSEVAVLLLRRHPQLLHEVNKLKQTPLHHAVARGTNAMVRLFLNHASSLSIDAQDRNGNTPLHVAIEHKDAKLVKTLLEQGADLEIRDSRDWDALRIAHMTRHRATIVCLEREEARRNEMTRRPSTATNSSQASANASRRSSRGSRFWGFGTRNQ